MLTLKHLKLHNVCQFDDFETELSTGLAAVTGPNGSGKTSLCRALMYGLTGIVDGMWGSQQDLQKDGKADPGYVEVGFSDSTDKYTIRRYTAASTRFPDVLKKEGSGDDPVRRRRLVDAKMEELLGIPCQLMFQVCWGRQGELAQLLTATSSSVSLFLAQLFDMKYLDKLRERIKAQMDRLVQLSPGCESALAEDEARLAELSSVEQLDGRVKALDATIADSDAKLKEMSQYVAGTTPRKVVEQITATMRSERDGLEAMLARMHADGIGDIDTDGHDEESLRTRMADLQADKESLRDKKADLQARLLQLNARVEVETAELARSSEIAASVDNLRHDSECRLCGRPEIPDSVSYAKNAQMLMALGDGTVDIDEEVNRHKAELESLSVLATAAKEAIGKLDADLDEINGKIADATMLASAIFVKTRRARIKQLEADIAKAEEGMTPDDVMQCVDALTTDLDGMRAERSGLAEELASLSARRAALESAIAIEKETVSKFHNNKDIMDALQQMRDVLSQQRVQARYMKSRIESLNALLERYMRPTGLPFTVRLDPDKRQFVYTTQDGYEHPSVHLSGAQKAMTAVALQMAVLAVMRPALNLYVIDEPTEALDSENTEIMASMFRKMNAMLPAISGTMLIVTRDEQLIAGCENVIEVARR